MGFDKGKKGPLTSRTSEKTGRKRTREAIKEKGEDGFPRGNSQPPGK